MVVGRRGWIELQVSNRPFRGIRGMEEGKKWVIGERIEGKVAERGWRR
jgi:hypothetical protein